MSVQAQIVKLLQDLQARHGLTYLFISHDLKVVRALAGQLLVMRAGEAVEQGSAREIFAAPQHAYTQQLLDTRCDASGPDTDERTPVYSSNHHKLSVASCQPLFNSWA